MIAFNCAICVQLGVRETNLIPEASTVFGVPAPLACMPLLSPKVALSINLYTHCSFDYKICSQGYI
jgi:hypothetical protein